MSAAAGDGSLFERLQSFVDELRGRGMPVSLSERIDAMRAVEGVRLAAGQELHAVLAATLVKAPEHRQAFDELFRLYFQVSGSAPRHPGEPVGDVGAAAELDLELDLDATLRQALSEDSAALTRTLAEQAVARFADLEAGRPVAGVLYEQQTVRGLRLDEMLGALMVQGAGGQGAGGQGSGGQGSDGQGAGGRAAGQDAEAVARRAQRLRQAIRDVIRELLVADRGVEAVARTLRQPLPEDVVIANATPAQLAEIRAVMRTLQRRLATTMMRQQRAGTGPLDLGATIRASMATGGVPVRVVHRKPQPRKAKLYVLADVSGSVSTFAAFTISLISGMAEVFSRLRTFAFVENTVEVTRLFGGAADPVAAVHGLNLQGGTLPFVRASTDYGRALTQFAGAVEPELGRRSTVLIFGDARGNYRPAEAGTLTRLADKAGAVYWLNPEREQYWGTGDSLMNLYAPLCTEARSCRTLGELRGFVEALGQRRHF